MPGGYYLGFCFINVLIMAQPSQSKQINLKTSPLHGKMLSITMFDSETRIYLDPPLENLREIQLLDCNVNTKRLINLKEKQTLLNEKSQGFTIPPGTYSLHEIQSIFLNDPAVEKITIIETNTFNYLYSNKSFKVKLTRGLSIGLGVPEVINPGKLYPINSHIKEPLRLMCSIVDAKSSYLNKTKNGELVKLSPSHLLANIPSKDYPTIPVQKYDSIINHFDLTILDNEWEKLDLKDYPITFSLRFR